MIKFFSNAILNDIIEITGDDAKHICKVLRMTVGEPLVVCDLAGYDYKCKIKSVNVEKVRLKIEEKALSTTEPQIEVNLYQGIPKGSKFDFIVQKSVELGVNEITPVVMHRCIPVVDKKSQNKKIDRYNKIALEAAKQSNRSKLPVVNNCISYVEAINKMKQADLALLFYEKSQTKLKNVLFDSEPKHIDIMIGPEGGFEISEIEVAKSLNLNIVSMGKRILRCETAPLFALSTLMFEFDN